MKIIKMLLLASALTMPLAYATITVTAEAAGKGAKKATKTAAKTCGTYKYWKDGKCQDARSKK